MAMLPTKLDDRTRAGWSIGQAAWRLGMSIRELLDITAPPASAGRIGRRAARRFRRKECLVPIYVYVYGPEGTHELSFTHSDEGGPVDAAELGSRRITGFSAQYAS